MAQVLVTGANGHIGANTVRSLLRHGHEVIPFVRRDADLRGIEKLGLKYRYGDIRNCEGLVAAMEGCDVVVHLAAVVRIWSKNPDEIIQPTLIGTRNVFTAAQQARIWRLVYTSSVAAVGSTPSPNRLRTEGDWNEDAWSPYFCAKVRSEQEAVRLSERLAVPTVRLCPAWVFGPYDYRITPSTAIILRLVNGNGPTWEGGLNIVDARDVAEAHAAAVDCGEPGARYVVGGANLELKEIGQLIRRFTGIQPKHVGAGRPVALVLGSLLDLGAKMTGSEPILTRSAAHEMIQRYWYYDCTLANTTFGLTPRGGEETVRDCVRWLLHVGAIKRVLAAPYIEKLTRDGDW